MAYGIKLHVWGDYACFTRPEMKVERVSYDVITPSAARGILEAIHWKPAIRWVIDKIHVLKPVRFESIRRNEVGSKISLSKIKTAMRSQRASDLYLVADSSLERQQRASTILRNVAYIIEAHFELTGLATEKDNEGKHLDMFNRRARQGQCFHQPCMGVREFPAYFSLIESEDFLPVSGLTLEQKNRDLGWMLHDIDFVNGMRPHFFKAELKDGVITVPDFYGDEVKT
ncbi:MAG: type I-C CRISPR-associated protein Cas5c [Bacillota bacterium]